MQASLSRSLKLAISRMEQAREDPSHKSEDHLRKGGEREGMEVQLVYRQWRMIG